MKTVTGSPRKSWKGQGVSFAPRVMRPLAVIIACLMMAMVVLPTSGVAVAAKYNNGKDDNSVRNLALIGVVGLGLAYFVSNGFGMGADNDDNPVYPPDNNATGGSAR